MDTSGLDPRRIYLLACNGGRWVAEPILTDGPAIRETLKAADLVRDGNIAAAVESLRSAKDRTH